jgi:hypothetical protein
MDLKSLSDDDLRALTSGGSAPPLTVYANRKLQSLSDEDLMALAKGNAPVPPMGSDGVSGDSIRARNAGDTRAQMQPADISSAYDFAQGRGDRPEQQAMAQAYVRREQADSPVSMAAGNTVRQIAKGVPIIGGLADEGNAAASAGLDYLTSFGQKDYGKSYEKGLDYQRARDKTFEGDHPALSTGLQIGGGVASGLAGGAAAYGAPVFQNAGRVASLGMAAGGSGAVGAVDGFTRGEGVDDRLSSAALGGGVGLFLGAAAPLAIEGVRTGTQRIADALTTNRELAKMGLDRGSADVLTRAMTADGTLGARGAANISAAGPNAMLADAGLNAAGILDTTIQRGGQGATLAADAVRKRVDQAGQSVTKALDTTLGKPAGLQTAEEAIRDGSKGARGAAYDAAYAKPIDYSHPTGMAIEETLHQVPGDIIASANRLMKVNGERSKQIIAKIADDGSVTYESLPDVRQLDYITRALNQAAKSGDGQGALGGQTPIGAAYENLSTKIRGLLKNSVPEYGAALQTAREPIQQREALLFGSKLLSPGVTRDEVARTAANMSPPQLEAARQGIRAHVDETIANVGKVMSDPNLDARQATKALRDLSSTAVRDKVAAIVGDGPAKALFRELDEASRAFELKAATAQNSKTFARTVTNDAIEKITAPGPVGELMEGHPVKAGKGLVQALLGTGPEARVAKQDAIYSRLAQALTGPTGTDAQKFVIGLEDAYKRRGTNEKLARALGYGAGSSASGGAYSYANSELYKK